MRGARQEQAGSRDAVRRAPRILTACLSGSITSSLTLTTCLGLPRFWTQALGSPPPGVRAKCDPRTSENAPVGTCFMSVTDPKTVKNRVHLDLTAARRTANRR